MQKIIAIVNVIAWAGFWAFGYLALTEDGANSGQILIAVILAALGGGVGMITFFWLVRYCERTGYAKAPKRAVPEHLRDDYVEEVE